MIVTALFPRLVGSSCASLICLTLLFVFNAAAPEAAAQGSNCSSPTRCPPDRPFDYDNPTTEPPGTEPTPSSTRPEGECIEFSTDPGTGVEKCTRYIVDTPPQGVPACGNPPCEMGIDQDCPECYEPLGDRFIVRRSSTLPPKEFGRPGSGQTGSTSTEPKGKGRTPGNNNSSSQSSMDNDNSDEHLSKNGPTQKTPCPVLISEGYKSESGIDLVIPLPGRDFVLSRHYTSGGYLDDPRFPWNVGLGWGLSVDGWINDKPTCVTGDCAGRIGGFVNALPNGVDITQFPLESSSQFYDTTPEGPSQVPVYEPLGSGLERVIKTPSTVTITVGDASSPPPLPAQFGDPHFTTQQSFAYVNVPVWIFDRPGQGQIIYFRTGDIDWQASKYNQALALLNGRILQWTDEFGNTATAHYFFPFKVVNGSVEFARPRLYRIYFNGTNIGPGSNGVAAWVEFEWYAAGAPSNELQRVTAYRRNSNGSSCLIASADYSYGGTGFTRLLQSVKRVSRLVTQSDETDSCSGPDYETYAVYRYAGSRLAEIYEPEQVEMYFERAATSTSLFSAVSTLATTGSSDYASKRIGYFGNETAPGYAQGELSGMVAWQEVLAGCSCAGAQGQRARTEYSYAREWTQEPIATVSLGGGDTLTAYPR